MNPTFIDPEGMKWTVRGYYLDNKEIVWTILMSLQDFSKFKRVKGVL
jgi:hypothetical protein